MNRTDFLILTEKEKRNETNEKGTTTSYLDSSPNSQHPFPTNK